MVEYLTDWVMGTSNQAADDDIKCLTRCNAFYSSFSLFCFNVLIISVVCMHVLGPIAYGACLLWCRDLDQASMEAVVSLLAGLPLQPEEGDGVELMEAKSQLFLK